MTNTIKVPAYFYDDHDSRELPTPCVLHRTARAVTVAIDDLNLPELLSDAKYYADPEGDFEPECRGLIASAKATVRAINKFIIC